eukprot:TRINITY_DN3181_c0_g1_i7.p4 TRINITY_DN3181_c0_g1~~TRINITY_DN3181_c0_g1_i7.p4  ORF type:complete len:202 (+),score=-10.56 TRINITY_DN3181_c0_g1_i7:345-950(+)
MGPMLFYNKQNFTYSFNTFLIALVIKIKVKPKLLLLYANGQSCTSFSSCQVGQSECIIVCQIALCMHDSTFCACYLKDIGRQLICRQVSSKMNNAYKSRIQFFVMLNYFVFTPLQFLDLKVFYVVLIFVQFVVFSNLYFIRILYLYEQYSYHTILLLPEYDEILIRVSPHRVKFREIQLFKLTLTQNFYQDIPTKTRLVLT